MKKIINILNRKFIYQKVQKKKILILEELHSNILINLFGKKKTEIISSANKLNLYIIMRLIFKFQKINQINYYIEGISIANPKVVITCLDSNLNFYKLKQSFPKVKFIAIQNGYRISNIFRNKKNLKCDMILCHGYKDIKFYQKNIVSRIKPIGSLRNNNIINKKILEKYCISYISQFRPTNELDKNLNILGNNYTNVTWGDYIKSEKKLILLLHKICKKKNIPFYIVGVSYNSSSEREWYYKLLNTRNINFIKRSSEDSSYKFLKKSKLITCMHSTLGYEFLSRGKKILFFSRKIKNIKKINKEIKFGYPYIKKNNGFFYTNNISEKKISKLIENIFGLDFILWSKKIKFIKDQLMVYDYKNKKVKEIISKYIF